MKTKMEIKNAQLECSVDATSFADGSRDQWRVRVRLSRGKLWLGPFTRKAAAGLAKQLNKKAEKKGTATIEV